MADDVIFSDDASCLLSPDMNVHSPFPLLLFSSTINLLLVNAIASADPGTAIVLSVLGQCYVVFKTEAMEFSSRFSASLFRSLPYSSASCQISSTAAVHTTIPTAPAPAPAPLSLPCLNLPPLPAQARIRQPQMATTNRAPARPLLPVVASDRSASSPHTSTATLGNPRDGPTSLFITRSRSRWNTHCNMAPAVPRANAVRHLLLVQN